MKDWTGNKKAVYITLGASNHSKNKRQEVDFYTTDPHALEILLNRLSLDGVKLPKKIYEPACGAGHLSEVLKSYGYEVISSDLYDHGYGVVGQDFLKSEIKAECFLTNPPYKFALEFAEHAVENVYKNGYVIMFLKIQFLEGKKRNKFFKKYPPKYVYVNSSRQNCARNGDFITYPGNSAACYAWFIWKEGFTGEPTIRWID